MKRALLKCGTAVLELLYAMFNLLPRRNRIVCLSRQSNNEPVDFALIREYVAEHHPDIEVLVLARALERPLPYLMHIVHQVFAIATSTAVVLDSYCPAVCLLHRHLNRPVIQMWHAMGNMKRFGYTALDEPEGRASETARLLNMHKGYTSILISSRSFIGDYAAGFGVNPSIIYEAPLPKADLLIDDAHVAKQRESFLRALPQLNGKQTIVYAPTFRKSAAPNEKQAMDALVNAIDFDAYNLIFMAHPVSTQHITDPRVIKGADCPPGALYAADYVISDYSTVIYEAGLLRKPVYLYAYDWDTYSKRRSLNIDIEHDVPTLFTRDPVEIMRAIETHEFNQAQFNEFIARNISIPSDESCTHRVVEHILSYMN